MASAAIVSAIISVVGVLFSVCSAMFVSGARWGQVRASLNDLEKDRVRHSDIAGIRDRLSRIEALFRLTLRDGEK